MIYSNVKQLLVEICRCFLTASLFDQFSGKPILTVFSLSHGGQYAAFYLAPLLLNPQPSLLTVILDALLALSVLAGHLSFPLAFYALQLNIYNN